MPGSGLGNAQPIKVVTTASTNLTQINAGYTEVSTIVVSGVAAANFVHFYDALSVNVTVGTTVAKWAMIIPASNGYAVELNQPVKFVNGLTIAITGTSALDSDSSNATANAVVNLSVS